MDQNNEQQDFQEYLNASADIHYTTEQPGKPNTFTHLSVLAGIFAFMSCSFIFTALIAGGLSILFAILSKGKYLKMHFLAKAGVATSIAGIVLSVIITSSVVYLMFNNPQYRELLNTTYESMYGMTFDEALEDIYPSTQGGGIYDNTGN